MIKSMTRSGIVTQIGYRSMLAGNTGFIPVTPATYFAGDGVTSSTYSTQINKMPYTTESFSLLSATLTYSSLQTSASNSATHGYAMSQNASVSNKLYFVTDTNSVLSYSAPYTQGGWFAGQIPETKALILNINGSTFSTNLLVSFSFSSDTSSTSTALQSYGSSVGPYGHYFYRTDTPIAYLGGGNPAGSYAYGGLVKYDSSTNSASLARADTTGAASAYSSVGNNGSTAGYIAGGWHLPYQTLSTRIQKVAYATDSSYSTLAAVLLSIRNPARVGVQSGVCAYYAGGRSSGSSLATSSTTVDKLAFATETVSNLASASVNRDGYGSWNPTG